MNKIPIHKTIKKSKHPLFIEFDSFFEKDYTSEERDDLIYDFYNRNIVFVNNIEAANSNLMIQKLLEMKIIYIRILDSKQEYKKCKPICDQIEILLSKLDKNYSKYDFLYLNGYKWIAINLGHLNKYFKSNKIFKRLITLDENKEFYIGWISGNYYRFITHKITYPLFTIGSIVFIWNAIIQLFVKNYDLYIYQPYSTISSILFFIAVLLYFNVNKLIEYLVKRKYK